MEQSNFTNVSIEIHFMVNLTEKQANKLLKEAEESGLAYGDPGKKELLRRYFVSEGTDGAQLLLQEIFSVKDLMK